MYAKNRMLFEGRHAEVYEEAFQRITRVIGNFEDVVSFATIANYQKLITLKVADLLMSEPPKIVAGEIGSTEQQSVENISERTDLHNKSYVAALDVPRCGDGLLRVYSTPDGGMIGTAQPQFWFPVVDPDDISIFTHHVIAWTKQLNDSQQELTVRIHEKGFYTEKKFLLQGFSDIAAYRIVQKNSEQRFDTGLDDFAIIPIPNVLTSDRVHGMDDYTDIDSIISELLVRIGQVSKILDKFAEPSVSGPSSSLEPDPITGKWVLKLGNFFARDSKDDAEVKYITWDASLDANFKQIELLINLLHAMSEMGGNILGDTKDEGGVLSGTALRFKMVSPLAKAKRISNRFKTALQKAVRLCSQLGGDGVVDLSDVPISVTFMDGLPNDPMEEATIMATRTANKPTISQKRALMVYDGMSPEDAENELQQIQDEEAAANPVMSLSTPFNGDNTPPKE
jgi:hypothetical protein